MGNEADSELARIVESARELLLWEDELSGGGIPAHASRVEATEAARGHSGNPLAPAEPKIEAVAPTESTPQPEEYVHAEGDQGSPNRGLATLADVEAAAAACTDCGLHAGRTRSVFHRGNAEARLVFVGEGPDSHEDERGVPFVGNAGELLDKMVAAMGLSRDEVYVCNVVKCRPPDNRTPSNQEAAACQKWLVPQLDTVAPDVIVALGKCAAEHLGCLSPDSKRWRGVWGSWRGIPVMPTYHPAFLLRSPQFKRPVWEDLQRVMKKLEGE